MPLTQLAMRELLALHAVTGELGDIMPMAAPSVSRAVARICERLEMEAWTPHDLRRTFRTGLAKLGVDEGIAELCLYHSQGIIVSAYNHHGCIDERRVALQLWSDHVARLVQAAPLLSVVGEEEQYLLAI